MDDQSWGRFNMWNAVPGDLGKIFSVWSDSPQRQQIRSSSDHGDEPDQVA